MDMYYVCSQPASRLCCCWCPHSALRSRSEDDANVIPAQLCCLLTLNKSKPRSSSSRKVLPVQAKVHGKWVCCNFLFGAQPHKRATMCYHFSNGTNIMLKLLPRIQRPPLFLFPIPSLIFILVADLQYNFLHKTPLSREPALKTRDSAFQDPLLLAWLQQRLRLGCSLCQFQLVRYIAHAPGLGSLPTTARHPFH